MISAQVTAAAQAPAASAQVRESSGGTELIVSRMPPPPPGKIYQVWLAGPTGGPRPTTALFSVTRDGSASVGVSGNLHGDRQLLVTAEPLGGSRHPTSAPVIVADLQSV